MTPRRWFHVLLGAILIPLLTLPVVWGVALYWLRRASDVEARRWARRMVGLALIDTLVAIVAVVLVAQEREPIALAPATQDRVVIGVMPDRSFTGPGARIDHVLPDGPATTAGLRAGDVIVRIAEKEIAGDEALRAVVGELEPGVPVSLNVKRGETELTASVTPRWSSEIPRRAPGFLEPIDGPRSCAPRPSASGVLQVAILLAAIAGLAALVAWRGSVEGAARGVWWTGLALVSAGIAGQSVWSGACVLLGGLTEAGEVFALWGSSLVLAAVALAARRFVGDRQAPAPAPTRTWGATVALGSWYMVAGAARLAVLLMAVNRLAPGLAGGSHPVESLARGLSSGPGPGLLLLVVPAIVFAPVGEELAFRGLLQPAFGTWLGPAGAIALTSVLFASMHWYYGLRLPLIVLVAAVLGWARNASGGLRAPIVLHMLVNTAGFVPILLSALRQG